MVCAISAVKEVQKRDGLMVVPHLSSGTQARRWLPRQQTCRIRRDHKHRLAWPFHLSSARLSGEVLRSRLRKNPGSLMSMERAVSTFKPQLVSSRTYGRSRPAGFFRSLALIFGLSKCGAANMECTFSRGRATITLIQEGPGGSYSERDHLRGSKKNRPPVCACLSVSGCVCVCVPHGWCSGVRKSERAR
jgi:hypothetical protein